jgi:hypothetical protein
MRDNSPNTFSGGYGCTLDLLNWGCVTAPTGPGHRGAEGSLRLVEVGNGFVEVEEDVSRGGSIKNAVDGIFRLQLTSGGREINAQWRSQYPERDIYVGSGVFRRK